jgi:hypothetical protein
VLNLSISDFDVEFDDGAVKNVGAPTKHATAKLWDVSEAEFREYGDRRVKLVCEDDAGNEVQVALFPEQTDALIEELEALQRESPVFD